MLLAGTRDGCYRCLLSSRQAHQGHWRGGRFAHAGAAINLRSSEHLCGVLLSAFKSFHGKRCGTPTGDTAQCESCSTAGGLSGKSRDQTIQNNGYKLRICVLLQRRRNFAGIRSTSQVTPQSSQDGVTRTDLRPFRKSSMIPRPSFQGFLEASQILAVQQQRGCPPSPPSRRVRWQAGPPR